MVGNDLKKKPVGRPRKYSGKRPTWTVRLEVSVGDQVKALAEGSGRSISEVCEFLIAEGLRARFHEMAERNRFLELQRAKLESRVAETEQQLLDIAENYADQADTEGEAAEPHRNIVELIESAVERAVKRAIQKKD